MVRPDIAKWGQTVSDLRRLSVEARHPRTRERFLALFMIASGQTNATRWAQEVGRTIDTVLKWVHCYNQAGPDTLVYRRTGGHPPFDSSAGGRTGHDRASDRTGSSWAAGPWLDD